MLVHASSDLLQIGCLVTGHENKFEVGCIHFDSLSEPCKVRL